MCYDWVVSYVYRNLVALLKTWTQALPVVTRAASSCALAASPWWRARLARAVVTVAHCLTIPSKVCTFIKRFKVWLSYSRNARSPGHRNRSPVHSTAGSSDQLDFGCLMPTKTHLVWFQSPSLCACVVISILWAQVQRLINRLFSGVFSLSRRPITLTVKSTQCLNVVFKVRRQVQRVEFGAGSWQWTWPYILPQRGPARVSLFSRPNLSKTFETSSANMPNSTFIKWAFLFFSFYSGATREQKSVRSPPSLSHSLTHTHTLSQQ